MKRSKRHDVIIVGGGISGLATAFWLRASLPELSVVVLEAGERAGGHVASSVEDGFTVDRGPSTLRAGAPDTGALIDALGIRDEVVAAAPTAKHRYVVRRGSLLPVPGSPKAAVTTPLLSPIAKLRALLEPFVGRGPESDESVSAFMQRRFGPEVANRLAEVMVSGLVAGDPERLSAPAQFPGLVDMERRHGSILRGGLARARAARRTAGVGPPVGAQWRSGGATGSRAGGAGLITFRGGLGSLTGALALALGSALHPTTAVTALRTAADGYELEVTGGTRLTASRVVLATPAPISADLLAEVAPAASGALRSIAHVGVGVAVLGYARSALPPLPDGFGFLAPRGEGVRSLGVQFSSGTFRGQAPDDAVLLRAICGGALDPGFLDMSDQEAIAAVRRDLETTLGITATPTFVRYFRKPAAIPQYELGHTTRLVDIERGLEAATGLCVIGHDYRGVGVNDCVREARALAGRLATAIGTAADGRRPEPLAAPRAVGPAVDDG